MKIGILTLPLHTNYGGILQAYALQTVLERMGHEVILIDKGWPPRKPLGKRLAEIIKWGGSKIIKCSKQRWHQIFFYNSELIKEHTLTFRFVNKYIHRRIQPNLSALKEFEFDAYVVGSDQIWREHHFRPIENAYLDFTDGWKVRRISYAASFGTDEWEYSAEQTANCGKLLKKFDAVSVREISGVELCKIHFNSQVSHVLDPTFLLTQKDYIDTIGIENVKRSPGNFLVYILDMTEEKQKVVNFIAASMGLQPFVVNSRCEDKSAPLKERIQPPVEQWLRGFYDAEFVFTDSFHACAFSINFNKPFLVWGNKGRGLSRFESLLSCFGLKDRLMNSADEVKNILNNTINWTKVNNNLAIKRAEAALFLQTALK